MPTNPTRVQTHSTQIDTSPARPATPVATYRWLCSCHRCGPWKLKIRSARNGAARHVAAMGRGA